MPKILRHSLFLPRIHSKVEKGNRSASFSFYFLFQIKSKYEMKKIYMYVLLTMHFLITKKIVSRILVRRMKLKNKINAELLHHPLKQCSYCLNKPRYNLYPIDHDLRIVKRYFLKLKIVFYILEGECKFLLQSVHHTLCFCRESVQQRVFWEQQLLCTFCFCYVHLPLETLYVGRYVGR